MPDGPAKSDGVKLGEEAADAAGASEEWTRSRTRLDVIRAYYGAVLAAEQVRTLDTAFRAARSHVGQARSAVRNGLATPSDALLAEVKAGEVETQLLQARQDADLARRQRGALLGTPDDTLLTLPAALPSAEAARALLAARAGRGTARR